MGTLDLIIKQDEEEPEGAEVWVEGTIGGRNYRFLLDTGAARSSVRFDSYTATFPSFEKHDSSGVFARSSYDLITVPTIEVGPISRENFTLHRAPENSRETRNLIGMDLLQAFSCHFLFGQKQVLVDVEEPSLAGAAWQELVLDPKFHPYVSTHFGELSANTVWDTGASTTIVDMAFVERHSALFREAGRAMGTDATGSHMETPIFIMASPTIGNHLFPPLKVAGVDLSGVNATTPLPMNLILGYNALSKANWLFDFPGRRWAITKLLA